MCTKCFWGYIYIVYIYMYDIYTIYIWYIYIHALYIYIYIYIYIVYALYVLIFRLIYLIYNLNMYHPSHKNIGKFINRNYHVLYMNEEVKKIFTPVLVISFHTVWKLSSYLVIAVHLPWERIFGSCQWKGKWCQAYHNVNKTEKFI